MLVIPLTQLTYEQLDGAKVHNFNVEARLAMTGY